MESFTESLHRLKDIHEKEMLGLQNKLLELNSERCRDAQRVEELCAKNQQLREQQRALKENLRALENRLRAGLCDRCTVTQELSRKKQQEFESSLLQNLQHVFILTNEITRLQEENETLKEEVTQLRGQGLSRRNHQEATRRLKTTTQVQAQVRAQVRESERTGRSCDGNKSTSQSVLPTAFPPTEKLGYKTSPVAKISPGANLPEPRAPDMSPQRISNQLHGTIAVVRPGAWACSADRGSTTRTPPLPPARGSPPSPPYEHSLPLDSFLRASRPSSMTCESLKPSLQADRLCLTNHHLCLHLRSPHSSPRAPATAPRGSGPEGPKAGVAEAWEDPMGLPGALVDIRDPRLEGALHVLLAQQLQARRQASGARPKGPHKLRETPPSPPVGSDSEGPEGKAAGAALPGGQRPQPTSPGSPRGKEATATQDHAPDKPLDLSEWGRARDAPKPSGRPGSLSPQTAHTPSPEPPQGTEPPAQSGPWGHSNGTKGTRAAEPEEPPPAEDPPHPLPRPHPSLPSLGGTGNESREQSKLSPHPQGPAVDGHPGNELSKPKEQQTVSDEMDEPDPLDSEMALSPKAEVRVTLSMPGEEPKHLCTQERGRGPQQKRKRTSSADPWDTASKKLS